MNRVLRQRRARLRRARVQTASAGRARWWAALGVVFLLCLALMGAGAGAAYAVYRSYANGMVPPDQLIAQMDWQSSSFYDRNGQFLYRGADPIGGLYRPIPLSEVSPYLIAATIATEDASFYENPGVNFRGLARAFLENFTPFGPGFLAGSGGSSITQQLVKNLYISEEERFERRIDRKVKEVVLALELKRHYSDDQILEWYLNQVFYGNNAYGVEAAAQNYFRKSAKDLTLAEAAMLAGLPQAPASYSPAVPENQERAEARRQQVLDLMLKHLEQVNEIPILREKGIAITPEQIEAARQEQIKAQPAAFPKLAGHFVDYTAREVVRMCQHGLFEPPEGLKCEEIIDKGGLRITTTLDLGLQLLGEETVSQVLGQVGERFGAHNGAIVAIRPDTGEILAMVGGRDYFNTDDPHVQGNVNVAAMCRSHGSAMKVFTYLTAFENGWVPSTFIDDAPLTTGTPPAPVENWNRQYLGKITVRRALSESVNTAAVRTLMAVGLSNVTRTSVRLGVTVTNTHGAADCQTPITQRFCGDRFTLGACEVRLVDMTYAYSVLANLGTMVGMPTVQDGLPEGYRRLDPAPVLRIEDRSGKVLYEYKPQSQQVVRPGFAYLITDILSKNGVPWSNLTIDRPVAAKTGTEHSFRDNVVIGYSTDLVVGVWMGNTDGTPMAEGAFSFAGSGPMWRQFMRQAHNYLGLPPRAFPVPPDVIFAECSGTMEVFVKDVPVTKAGLCRSPTGGVEPEVTPTPTPPPPPAPTPTPTPTPTPAPKPSPTPTPTVTPTPSSGANQRGRGNEGPGPAGELLQDILAPSPDQNSE